MDLEIHLGFKTKELAASGLSKVCWYLDRAHPDWFIAVCLLSETALHPVSLRPDNETQNNPRKKNGLKLVANPFFSVNLVAAKLGGVARGVSSSFFCHCNRFTARQNRKKTRQDADSFFFCAAATAVAAIPWPYCWFYFPNSFDLYFNLFFTISARTSLRVMARFFSFLFLFSFGWFVGDETAAAFF